MVRPYMRVRWPRPPPRVRPPTPVVEMMPLGVASPNAWVAWSTSPQVQPPSTRTVRAAGSTRMPFIRDRSMTRPSSQVPRPAPLCPPPRTASVRPLLASEIDGADDVGDVDAAGDQARVAVDHAVIDLPRGGIVRVAGADQRAAQACLKVLNRRFSQTGPIGPQSLYNRHDIYPHLQLW